MKYSTKQIKRLLRENNNDPARIIEVLDYAEADDVRYFTEEDIIDEERKRLG